MEMFFNALHELKADSPTLVALEKETEVNAVHPLNAFFPMVVTLSALVTAVRDVHPLKASSAMEETFPRSAIVEIEVTPLKAVPIDVMDVEIILRLKLFTIEEQVGLLEAGVISFSLASKTFKRVHVEKALMVPDFVISKSLDETMNFHSARPVPDDEPQTPV